MKTIGIVGGLAWPSTITYYKLINEEIAKRLGGDGLHCASLLLAQTDFEQIAHAQARGDWQRVGALLAGQANRLKAAGADFFLLACNTVHAAAEYLEAGTDLPYIHIVDPAAELAVAMGAKTVGLLGSGYTMRGTFFRERLQERYGLHVLTPAGAHFDNIHNALYQELVKDVFLPETREKFRAAIRGLTDRGVQAVILGCTEFGLLVKPEDCAVPLIDTTYAHAMAAVDSALA